MKVVDLAEWKAENVDLSEDWFMAKVVRNLSAEAFRLFVSMKMKAGGDKRGKETVEWECEENGVLEELLRKGLLKKVAENTYNFITLDELKELESK